MSLDIFFNAWQLGDPGGDADPEGYLTGSWRWFYL